MLRNLRSGVVLVLLAGAAAPSYGQNQAPGLAVSLVGPPAQPGGVLELRVEAAMELTRVTASAFGHALSLYPAPTPRAWRGLVGIDLAQAAGRYVISVRGEHAGAPDLTAEAPVRVSVRPFRTRRLRVAGQFVDPSNQELDRIHAESDRLAAVFAGDAPKWWDGPFTAPVGSSPTSNFGTRSVFNGQPRAPHAGVDFHGRVGLPIAAPNGGRIVLAEALFFTGNTVIIDHGLGLFSLLAHLSAIEVSPGDAVSRGEVVGRLGATGRVSGPHLHWAVRLNGTRVDPLRLIELLGPPSPAATHAVSQPAPASSPGPTSPGPVR